MYRYKIRAKVNGMRTEEIIAATSSQDAERLFRAKYPKDAKININSRDRVD